MARKTSVQTKKKETVELPDYRYGFSMPERSVHKTQLGVNRDIVAEISAHKKEPEGMRDFRLKGLEHFEAKPLPEW